MVAAVAIFAAASCNKELPQGNELPVGETVVYTASVDGADTKAVLNEETKKSEWVAGDAITVHDGEKGWTFVADKDGQHADFSNSEGFGDYRPVIAFYPAGGDYTANIPAKTARVIFQHGSRLRLVHTMVQQHWQWLIQRTIHSLSRMPMLS